MAFCIFWGTVLALLGIALGYFLAVIPVVIIVTIGIVLLFLILQGPYPAEAGLGVLVMAAMDVLVIIPMLITSIVVGTVPLLPFVYSVAKIVGTKWSWLFR